MNILNANLKNAVIYCRVSTDEQAHEGESLSAQERRCMAYCESKGLSVLKAFIEAGESGRTEDRTQLKKLLAYCFDRAHKVSAVVCLKQDRFSRNLLDFRKLESAFSARGIALIFVEGNNERNAQGKLIRNISGSFAEFESDINSERTRAGIAEAVLNGRWLWPLLGYSFRDNEYGKRQLYPNDRADIVRDIFKLAHEGIYTQMDIIAKMKRNGFKISKQTLSALLKNPVYCGLLPDRYLQNGGKLIKGIHEPLISETMFYEVQAILSGRARTAVPRQRNNPNFPLRRFVICAHCGKIMTAAYVQGKKIKVGYYQCTTKGCPRHQKKILEPAFLDYLRQVKPTPHALQVFEREVVEKFNARLQKETLLRKRCLSEIAELENQKSKVIEMMARGSIPELDGKATIERINTDIADKNIYANADHKEFDLKECWEEAKEFISRMDIVWEKGDIDLKQRVQGLITPKGFVFENNLIKPLESPHFMGVFGLKKSLVKYGVDDEI